MGEFADYEIDRLIDGWYGSGRPRRTRAPVSSALAKARMIAHNAFDPLWKDGSRTRSEAYGWLAGKLGMRVEHCHFGMMDIAQCERAAEICRLEKFPKLTDEI